MKAGTPTAFQDRNGVTIKVGDRIKHADGTIHTIDRYGSAASALGFRYSLYTLGTIHRGMDEKGDTYARIMDWVVTDDPAPAKPEGPTVKPGDDAQNMAPDRVRDPRNASLKKENWKKKTTRQSKLEAAAVADGVTVGQARRILTLQDFQDEDLCDELRERGYHGYHGEITKTKTIKI